MSYVPIRSVQPSRDSCKSLYVPIRSLYVPYTFSMQNGTYSFKCYTFLYVPCQPPTKSSRWYTDQDDSPVLPMCRFIPHLVPCGHPIYVPIRSLLRSHTFRTASHLCSIRSSRTFALQATCPQVAFTFAFLYVPAYVPIGSGRPLYSPASSNSSYTFRIPSNTLLICFLYCPYALLPPVYVPMH